MIGEGLDANRKPSQGSHPRRKSNLAGDVSQSKFSSENCREGPNAQTGKYRAVSGLRRAECLQFLVLSMM